MKQATRTNIEPRESTQSDPYGWWRIRRGAYKVLITLPFVRADSTAPRQVRLRLGIVSRPMPMLYVIRRENLFRALELSWNTLKPPDLRPSNGGSAKLNGLSRAPVIEDLWDVTAGPPPIEIPLNATKLVDIRQLIEIDAYIEAAPERPDVSMAETLEYLKLSIRRLLNQ